MEEVIITKKNNETIHFINSTCKITDEHVIIRQYNENNTHHIHVFNLKDIKSVIYNL